MVAFGASNSSRQMGIVMALHIEMKNHVVIFLKHLGMVIAKPDYDFKIRYQKKKRTYKR